MALNEINERGCPTTTEIPADEETQYLDPAPFVRHGKDGLQHLDLLVRGARCAGCLNKIEKGVASLPGVEVARLNLTTGQMAVAWRGELAPERIPQTLVDLGYEAQPFSASAAEDVQDKEGRLLIKCLAVSGFAMMNIMLLSVSVWSATNGDMGEATRGLMHWVSGLIALPAAAYAGQPFFRSAWRALKGGHANMDVPISLAVLLALGISLFEAANLGEHTYFDAAVMLLFFLLIGRTLDHRLRARARGAADDLLRLQTVTARRVESDGSVQAVQAKDLDVGDKVLLVAGDRCPSDGRVIEGTSEADFSLVTGESAPHLVKPGDTLYSGVLNLTKRLEIEVTSRAEDSLVAELARLIETGTQSKARFVRLADKAAQLYVPVVHTLAALTFLGWVFLAGTSVRDAVLAAAAVLIITCPCALGLAVPAVQTVAVGRLFRRGILVKSGDALERLAQADMVVFDKTGTLTLGEPQWLNPEALDDHQLERAARLARASRHPLARVLAERAGRGLLATEIEEIPGQGLTGSVEGVAMRLGRADFVGVASPDESQTGLWFRDGENEPVHLRFEDQIRPDARTTIDSLKERGLSIAMLTGDAEGPAAHVADTLGIDEWQARQTPADKAAYLTDAKAAGRVVAMVGDGLNDAPSLALAHVSLSPGTAADASQAAADFVFQGRSLAPVTEAFEVAKQSTRRVLENFGLAAGYNVFAIPLAVLGFVTPMIAALAMSGSSIVVTLNSLRLKRKKSAQ